MAFLRPRVGEVGVALARTATLALVVILPLAVIPWGAAEGYSQAKVLVLYTLTAVVLVGWALARWGSSALRWQITVPEVFAWGYVLALLLSTAASADPLRSFVGSPLRREGVFTHLAYVGLYFAGVHLFGASAGVRRLAVASGAAALVAIGYGLLQLFVPPLFPAEAFMRGWYGGLAAPRLVSLVGGPVVFGGYLATVVPLLLAVGITSSSWGRAVWLAGAVLGCVAAGLTLTRAAWLALPLGLGLFVAMVASDTAQVRRAAAVVTAAVVLSVAAVLVASGPREAAVRASSTVDVSSGSVAQRLYTWKGTLRLIGARPWLGWGLETLGEVFPYDRDAMVPLFGPRPVIIDRAHNDLLHVAVSVGVPGAAAYAAFWAAVVHAAWRLWRRTEGADRVLAAGWLASVAAYLVQVQFSFSTVAVTPLVWLLAGAACGWVASSWSGPVRA
jgi:putative inorganic carbon (HCO3(-)) transporter